MGAEDLALLEEVGDGGHRISAHFVDGANAEQETVPWAGDEFGQALEPVHGVKYLLRAAIMWLRWIVGMCADVDARLFCDRDNSFVEIGQMRPHLFR